MLNWTVNEFKEKILKGQSIPEALENILQNQCCLETLESELEFELIEEGRIEEEISHTYIKPEQRKDKAISANIFAINKVFEYITFFAEAENGMLLGYWHGTENLNILKAPLVSYDTEGQFELYSSNRIIEELALRWTCEEEEEYEELQNEFSKCNVKIADIGSNLGNIETKSNPAKMHDELYKNKLEELKN